MHCSMQRKTNVYRRIANKEPYINYVSLFFEILTLSPLCKKVETAKFIGCSRSPHTRLSCLPRFVACCIALVQTRPYCPRHCESSPSGGEQSKRSGSTCKRGLDIYGHSINNISKNCSICTKKLIFTFEHRVLLLCDYFPSDHFWDPSQKICRFLS